MVVQGSFGNQGGMRGCEDIDHSLEGMRGDTSNKDFLRRSVPEGYDRVFYVRVYEGATRLPPWSQNPYKRTATHRTRSSTAVRSRGLQIMRGGVLGGSVRAATPTASAGVDVRSTRSALGVPPVPRTY